MSIESLKQAARKHEQKEEWKKALDQYNKALTELAREEQVDIGLYNRVGDLYVRVGDLDSAVEHYDRAVDLYREAYLPNNAIAVCKKIIRNVPDRHRAYLVIGQIRAEQGFIPDARTNFLTYAERMSQAGDLDESFRALIEFADLAPDDVGVRLSVADQMIASQRETEAVEQLKVVRAQYLKLGNRVDADDIESRILNLDPEADLNAIAVTPSDDMGFEGDIGGDFGEISFGEIDMSAGSEEEVSFGGGDAPAESAADDAVEPEPEPEAEEAEAEVDAGLGGFEIEADAAPEAEQETDAEVGAGDEEEAEPLPMMEVDLGEEEAEPLPMMEGAGEAEVADDALETSAFDLDSGSEDEVEAVPLPTMDFDAEDDAEAEAEPLPMMEVDFDGEPAEEPAASDVSSESVEEAIEDAAGEMPEIEIEADEPALEISEPEPVEEVEATAAEVPAAEPEPAAPAPTEAPAAEAPDGGFVDLGAMILGDSAEKSTRFTVQYQEPTGDEEADFARMLSQFKDKVSENLDSSDVRAHYDLGTAYKEMGLLDEAISSFQAALRASADHLPTYELMGQTFMEMGQPEAAVKSLERALDAANTVEDELVGIYYYLGRAHEELQNRESAVEYYDRVFALDINFADVTERLRELR